MSHATRIRDGFSLVELLVVIGIIAVLIGILLPALSKAQGASRRLACAANLKSVGVAMRIYLNESKDVMPVAARLPSANLNDKPRIADVLAPHLDSPEAFLCPSDPNRAFFNANGSSFEYNDSLGGQRVDRNFLTQRLGESRTPVMFDYQPFHGQPGQPGSTNYLFADMHVGDLR